MRKLSYLICFALSAAATLTFADDSRTKSGVSVETGALGVSAAAATPERIKEWFHEAPSILPDAKIPLKGQPLWHTNGELSDEIIHEIFEVGQQNGFGGITFLPLTKTTPKYLSEEYLTQYGKALELAKKLGMKVIFYDDLDYPSGSAGWRLKEQFPEATIKRLDKAEWLVKGPSKFAEKCSIPLSDKVVYGVEGGVLQSAVAMNLDTFERVNIRECVDAEGNVRWDAPEGNWKVMLFVCVSDPHGIVDFMSQESVKKFFSLTYDVFYEKFKEYFGTTITSIFFDDIGNGYAQDSRAWALEFNAKYRELYGTDPELDYPALFYSIGDETPSARDRLWTTRNRLFEEGYPGMVKKWREERGLDMIATGHPQGPYVIQPVDMATDAMTAHRGTDAVLFDSIHYYGHGRDGFKIPTSAAFNFDYPFCYVEIYGNYRDNTFDKSMMLRSAMEIFARGGNVLLPHGTWSDPATVYIPPEISWRNPKLEGFLPGYGDFVSRCSLLLQGGRHVADIAMLYPVDNLKAFWHFPHGFITTDYPRGVLIPRETDYLAIGSQLTTRIWRDFTFVHPDILNEKCSVEKRGDSAVLRLNNASNWEEYKCVILPGADVISWSNLEKIVKYYDEGGRVIATTRLPSMAAEGPEFNEKVREAIMHIFALDPLTQAPRDAIATGQEDIVLPISFLSAREINKAGEYVQRLSENPIFYEDTYYRDRAAFVPRPTTENLQAAIDRFVETPDVKIEAAPGTTIPTLNVVPRWDYPLDGMFQYMHKVKNGLDVYYFANSSNSDAEFVATLRGAFDSLEIWDPISGETTAVAEDKITVDETKGVTSVRLSLKSIESLFVVGVKK